MTPRNPIQRIKIVDSHTGGEPTRVVVSGGPELGRGSVAEKLALFRERFDNYRSAIVNEPRGSDVLVGALLVEPADKSCAAGVIFFNNVGYLGMCGHGTIGVVETLAHLGRIAPGVCRLETPAGTVSAELCADGSVALENVLSYRYKKSVDVNVPGIGVVRGDIAWGGNWFFLIEEHRQKLELQNVEALIDYCCRTRQALKSAGVSGENAAEIDHIELFFAGKNSVARSKNFVLCPGLAYDRSPCGTGTSAKLACLAADGKLREGDEWIQESIIGSIFKASYKRGPRDGEIIPTITGAAHIVSEAELILDFDRDPFCWGIRAE
ncbi:MAG TPA: 4-hydroxyproline epimerase [Planctomycetota bacterium]|nr:4-hydroxyproline epimerase [Planctomycetota bacterium]